MNNFIVIKYTAKFTHPESMMLEHMQTHPSNVFDEYRKKLCKAMVDDFNPFFAFMHLGLQIEDIQTTFFGSNFSEQVTIMKLNKDIETLLKKDEIRLP